MASPDHSLSLVTFVIFSPLQANNNFLRWSGNEYETSLLAIEIRDQCSKAGKSIYCPIRACRLALHNENIACHGSIKDITSKFFIGKSTFQCKSSVFILLLYIFTVSAPETLPFSMDVQCEDGISRRLEVHSQMVQVTVPLRCKIHSNDVR